MEPTTLVRRVATRQRRDPLEVAAAGCDSGLLPETAAAGEHAGREGSLLESIVEQLADGIVVVDDGGVIRFANAAAVTLFGRGADELVEHQFGLPLGADDSTEIEVIRPGGTPVTVELRVARVPWRGASAHLVSLRDVSDRKAAEAREHELASERAARAEAEAANRAKSDFLATMSHELRTPLNAVLGYAELLDMGVGGMLNESQRQQLSRITVSGRHLLALVDEVLDVARIEAGQLALHCGVVDAQDTASSALMLVAPQAEAAGVELSPTVHTDEGVDLRCMGDENRVRQIVVNLLMNAIRFTPAGGHVALSLHRSSSGSPRMHGRGPWISIRVSDTGIGIDESQHEHIFQAFMQVESGHTRPHAGTGLGLTISRRLARLMEGDITVCSSLGRGAEFTLSLPAAAADPDIPAGTTAADAGANGARAKETRGMGHAGEALLAGIGQLVDAIVHAMRQHPDLPSSRGLRYSQLTDHLPTLLADIATTLIVLEEAGGTPSPMLSDSTEIQRLLGERHGTQRAQLGWTLSAMRAEYGILRQYLLDATGNQLAAGGSTPRDAVRVVLERLLSQVEEASVRAYERACSGGGPDPVLPLHALAKRSS